MVRITNHEGRANHKATWALRQLSRDDPQAALIELFASQEPIDAETRSAVLAALIAWREGDTGAVRLRVVRPAHRPRTMVSELEILERAQRIGAETAALLDAPQAVEKTIIADVMAKYGVSETEVRNSEAAWRERKFTVSRHERK